MNKTYETSTLPEKAIGKARQIMARTFMQSRLTLPEGFRAVTCCFDDFPASAGEFGAKTLEDCGARGTYHACFGLLDGENQGGRLASADMILSLAQSGHEIGCHTYDHVNCSFVAANDIAVSCRKNIDAAAGYGLRLNSFSYPQGGVTLTTKKIMQKNYRAARSGFQGINQNCVDAHCLKSVPLYEHHSHEVVFNWIDQVESEGGWLILYTHDVCGNPSPHGASEKFFRDVVSYCANRNLPIRTIGEALEQGRLSLNGVPGC